MSKILYGSFVVEAGSCGDEVAVEAPTDVRLLTSSVLIVLFDIFLGEGEVLLLSTEARRDH